MYMSIQNALSTTVELSRTIRPRALALLIRSVLEDEIALNQYGQIFLPIHANAISALND